MLQGNAQTLSPRMLEMQGTGNAKTHQPYSPVSMPGLSSAPTSAPTAQQGLAGGTSTPPATTAAPTAQPTTTSASPAEPQGWQLYQDYAGQPFVDAILQISGQGGAGANTAMQQAVQGLQAQADASGQTIDQVLAGLGVSADQIQQLSGAFGGAFDTGQARNQIGAAAQQMGSEFDTSGAQGALRGVNTDFGTAFDTQGARDTLGGMDFGDIQSRYESQFVDQMVDPVMSRMHEDQARRMAQLEGSSAAIGGTNNTRMAVEMARTTDEGLRSRAETEANLRNTALRQAQDLGLQEAGLSGQFATQAADLGLGQTEQQGRLAESSARAQADFADRAAQLGLSEADQAATFAQTRAGMADMAAHLGMQESELDSLIAERQSRFGLDREAAARAVMQDQLDAARTGFDQQGRVADTQQQQARTALDAAGLGITGAGVGLEQAELERQIRTEQGQAPLTMEAWYRNLIGSNLGSPLPGSGGSSTKQSGGGAGVGSQILGAGTSLLGSAMMAGLISDERVKTEVRPLEGALDIIRRQRPSSYEYTDPQYDRVPQPGRRSAGLMAQDLEDIPGAVIEHNGVKMLDAYPVMSTIAAAVQELDRKVEAMSHG